MTPSQVPKRVLVADDEMNLARSLARLLSNAGYDVVTVGDGDAALLALGSQEFDVVLSDIQMPGMSGLELLRLARERDMDVPIVLMTADPRIETAADAVEHGALQYLVKPIAADVLLKAMERAAKLHVVARMKRETLRMLGQLEDAAGDRTFLKASFERALDSMWMAFQPIVAGDGQSRSRGPFGYEALLRSSEPSLPTPSAVIGAAEQLKRLPELGRRIRALVAEAAHDLPDESLLFVNLHTHDLLDPHLLAPEMPLTRIAKRVVLEITERAALDDVKDVRARISALRATGFRVAVDDLGAGYAGLASFALLEPDFVKLDMSLVRGVDASPLRQKLIASMSAICREMGMGVVAEGIETIEERDMVMALGCDLLQGFLLGRPGRPFPSPSWPAPMIRRSG
jgi:EAL domain-containing protein (putative c-di-GMP-specific phosphodiesterase class I)